MGAQTPERQAEHRAFATRQPSARQPQRRLGSNRPLNPCRGGFKRKRKIFENRFARKREGDCWSETNNNQKLLTNNNLGSLRLGTPGFTLITISLLTPSFASIIPLTILFSVHYTRSPRGGRLRCEGSSVSNAPIN